MLPKNSPRDQSQRKSSFKIPAAISLETKESVTDVIELNGEEAGNNELYYENTAFLGITLRFQINKTRMKPITPHIEYQSPNVRSN
jgi:hypothetical protein